MSSALLCPETAGLLLVDIQEGLFSKVEMGCQTLSKQMAVLAAFQLLESPVFVAECRAKGFGQTIPPIRDALGARFEPLGRTAFSCVRQPQIREVLLQPALENWVIVGFEAHVSILQTAKELLALGKKIVVLNDGISARSVYDYSNAIAELRDCGARVTTTETLLFELLADSSHPHFNQILEWVEWDCDSHSSCCRV